jgi:hypothetical protein
MRKINNAFSGPGDATGGVQVWIHFLNLRVALPMLRHVDVRESSSW